jgi:hypothetical protein
MQSPRRRRRADALVVAIAAALTIAASSNAAAKRSVLVTVLDDDGAAIFDLNASDFSVREDGVVREVTDVRLATDPLFATILIDLTQPRAGTSAPVAELRSGIAGFINRVRQFDGNAKIAVIEVSGSAVMTVDFDAGWAALDRRVRRLFPTQQAGAVMLEAFVDAGRLLGEAASPRRAIVCIERDSIEHSNLRPTNVATDVLKAGAAVWVVSLRADGAASSARESLLDQLPALSGGLRITALVSTPLGSILRNVATALTTQYVVTYETDAAAPGQIQPRVTRGAKVLLSPWIR